MFQRRAAAIVLAATDCPAIMPHLMPTKTSNAFSTPALRTKDPSTPITQIFDTLLPLAMRSLSLASWILPFDHRLQNLHRQHGAALPKKSGLPSPRSGRVKVTQHFSAGNRSATSPSPCNGRLINPRLGTPCGFSRAFHGLSLVIAPIPPINR